MTVASNTMGGNETTPLGNPQPSSGVFISFFVIGGFSQGFGILYVSFLDTFDQTDSITSLLVGVRSACMVVSGPLSTVLSERYTERKVAIAGALITSIAFSLSFFATRLEFLVVTLGALMGVGTSILIGPSNVAMGNYFVKKRSRATTVTSCGGCIGMMVVPILLQKLVERYSVRGALLIYGGLSLHLVLTGAFLRPLRADDRHSSRDALEIKETHTRVHQRDSWKYSDVKRDKSNGQEVRLETSTREKAEIKVLQEETCTDSGASSLVVKIEDGRKPTVLMETEKHSNQIFHGTELPRIPTKVEPRMKRNRCSVFSILLDTLDFSLLKKPVFLLILASAMLSCIPYFTMTMFFVPFMESQQISRDTAAIFLSVMGGCDIVGRLVCGAVADRKPLQPKHVIVVTSILAGVLCSLLVIVSGFYGFLGIVIAYGLVSSAPAILVLPATIHFVGLAALPKAVGALMFFGGLSSSAAPSLLGLLKDHTGKYSSVFPVLGSLYVLAGLVLLIEPLARRMNLTKHSKPPGETRNNVRIDGSVQPKYPV